MPEASDLTLALGHQLLEAEEHALARGIILQLREEGYVLAAEMSGCRPWRMMRRHLLPNSLELDR